MRIRYNREKYPRAIGPPMTPEQQREWELRSMVTDCAVRIGELSGWDETFIRDMAAVTRPLTETRSQHICRIHAALHGEGQA